ncbi:serine/threonine-protein kinase [Pseudoduganella namucuonensis]|uniref:Serine/threonine protein kinase n=1 Tax=Pseudoduganella namucuonensis TaxID=1035707 RepID=A0A1I7L577_9BURK|nr:serine/threonine-protein kinase [Pseudoduganella namucuonensis]SFV04795.1 serine/threonine protein kinase [Pseudoduganella namucuonensis]
MQINTFGPYTLRRELARGVWLAESGGREVALKLAPAGGGAFLRAAWLAARLDHPGVVAVLDAGERDGTAYVVSEHVPGPSLAAALEAGPPPLERALAWTGQLLEALAHVHKRGVVHRDIKPSNLLLAADGGLRIADFGLACRAGPAEAHGTPAYMAPEQMRGQVDQRSDLYAAGVVLYQLLEGRKPYRGTPFEVMRLALAGEPPPLPRALARYDAVLARALAPDAGRRFQTADDFLAGLHSCSTL